MPQESSLITPEYVEQQKAMFDLHPTYGTAAKKWAEMVAQIATSIGPQCTILDYGCGREILQELLPQFVIDGYDPAIEDRTEIPAPHDLVCCLDVLEHIEPHKIEAVLNDLERVTEKVLLLNIATVPSVKLLPDGRNAHLIVKPLEWWLPKLWRRWAIDSLLRDADGVNLQITCSRREDQQAREQKTLQKVKEAQDRYRTRLESGEIQELTTRLSEKQYLRLP